MSSIQVSHLTFGYEGSYDLIFNNVSFSIDTNWKLGLIGRNGKGKTTFLKLLLGMLPYQGKISSGNKHFSYFPFSITQPERLTAELLATMVSDCEFWRLERDLSLLQVAEDCLSRSFSSLSQGERTKILLAALFQQEEAFLLIDEPTNHLDIAGRQILADYLRSKKSFILVSHDRTFLDRSVDHILAINQANIQVQKGNFSSWQQNKVWQDQFEQAEKERLQREIKKLAAATKRTAKWSDQVEKSKTGDGHVDRGYIGAKAAKLAATSKAIAKRQQQALHDKSALLKNTEQKETLRLEALHYSYGPLLEAKDLQLFYSKKPVTAPLSFQVTAGQRWALCGPNGCGKSTLLKLLAGEDIFYQGTYRLARQLVISYVPQDTSFLQGSLRQLAQRSQIEESQLYTILRKMGFSRSQFAANLADYSEGQKKKVLLAKSLCEKAHLYLWDEPLNYLDIISRIQLEELLQAYRPTLVFVEHDAAFCQAVATDRLDFV